MLKFITDNVPEELTPFYEQTDDGNYRLKVEGVVPAADIEGLKNKNRELITKNKQYGEELVRFKTIFGDEGIPSPDKFNERLNGEVEKRVADMRVNYETKINELNGTLQKTGQTLENIVLSDAIKSAAVRAAVAPTAVDDVISRARSFFVVKDGTLQAKEGTLDKEGKPYSAESWVNALQEQAPHLFQKSQGSGIVKSPVRPGAVQQEMTAAERIAAGVRQRMGK